MNMPNWWLRRRLLVLALGLAVTPAMRATQSVPSFSATLSTEQRKSLGLEKLSPHEIAALDAAVEAYRNSTEANVVKRAAESAVAEYRKQAEPAVAARAVDAYKRKQAETHQELIEAKIDGRFTGWDGHTEFKLDNGQIWRQVGSDMYYLSPQQNTPIEIRLSKYGSYRLHLSDGAWVTVVRIH